MYKNFEISLKNTVFYFYKNIYLNLCVNAVIKYLAKQRVEGTVYLNVYFVEILNYFYQGILHGLHLKNR